MSLEFALQYTCPLRANYSERHLREWGRLSSLHARLTTGDASAPSVDKLEWVENASAEIERMHALKTGALIRASILMAGLSAGRISAGLRQPSLPMALCGA